jgi:gamma-glutamylputrescine oxidase
LAAAANADELDALRGDLVHVRDAFGDEALQWLDADTARATIGSTRYAGALRDPRAFPLDPLALLHGLAGAAIAAGAVLHEDTPALALHGGAPWRITTPGGEILADEVVLTVQSATGALWRPRRDLTLPIWTSMIATVPLDLDRRTRILPGGEAVYDASPTMAYWRMSPDGRVLFGAGAAGRAQTPAETSRRLKERLVAIYPMLADVAVERVWSGIVDLTLDRLPRFGRDAERLWVAHGLGGHGVAAAVGGGEAIARAIGGDRAAFDVVAGLPQRRIPFAGMVTRWAVPAAFAWLRAASRWSGRRR